MQLKAEQQHGDRAGAGDEPAGQTKYDDLARRDVAVGELAPDILGMCKLVGIGVAAGREFEPARTGLRVDSLMGLTMVMTVVVIVVMGMMMPMVVMAIMIVVMLGRQLLTARPP